MDDGEGRCEISKDESTFIIASTIAQATRHSATEHTSWIVDAFSFRSVCHLHQCALVISFVDNRPVCSLSKLSGFDVF